MKHSSIALIFPCLALLMACKGQNDAATDSLPAEPMSITVAFTDTVEIPVMRVDRPAPKRPAPKAPSARPAAKPAPKAKGPAEIIYVETEGAQGRVWGHVTMRGDRGTGTIHDWDENTLTVSVTRHGNELFAVDQNSRQYVFKLKK